MTDSTQPTSSKPEPTTPKNKAAEAVLESELMPPENGALSVPPPVPQKKPGFLRRLFTSRKRQEAVAIQNGYLEMVDLIRSIRTHLDRQETVQTRVLDMLEKVPDTMDRQHEVMTLFKQQLEGNLENDKLLAESMGQLNGTLSGIDESQKASTRTVTDLIHRSRESEQLLREVMRRAERRMTILLVFFFLLVMGLGAYFLHWQKGQPAAEKAAAAMTARAMTPEEAKAKPAAEKAAVKATPVAAEKPAPEFKSEQEAEAIAKAAEKKKADELKKKTEEKAKVAAEKKKAKELKAQKKEEEAKAKQLRDAKKAEKKKKAAEVKAKKKAEKARIKAEKKAKAAEKRKAKKEADAAEKKAREAQKKTDKEAKEAAAKEVGSAQTPEFTLERIQPADGEAAADKPVSLP